MSSLSLRERHLERVRAVLDTFGDDVAPGEALIALEDAAVAVSGGILFRLSMEAIKRNAREAIDESIADVIVHDLIEGIDPKRRPS